MREPPPQSFYTLFDYISDSDIIIFDEATTHLDRKSEKRIQKLINENFKNKICIIISHRIWNNPELKVYFMNNGRIYHSNLHPRGVNI